MKENITEAIFQDEIKPMQVEKQGIKYLNESASWMKFMGIAVTVVAAFQAMSGLFAFVGAPFLRGTKAFEGLEDFPFGFFGAIYIITAAIYLMMGIYLLRAARSIRDGVTTRDPAKVEEGFLFNRKYWKFSGVVVITVVAICVMVIPVVAILIATSLL